MGIILPEGTTLHSKEGFANSSEEARLYEPRQGSENYSLTYTFKEQGKPGNTSLDIEMNPYKASENWSLAPLPEDYNGQISYRTPLEAVVGQHTVYFGNYTTTTKARGCHEISLVVPDVADLDRDPEAILDSLLYTDKELAGNRYDRVTLFATPEQFESEAAGVALGADIVISTTSELYNAKDRSNIWIHEYIHTWQSYETTDQTEWWTEASAEYLSLRLGLESGYLSPTQYNYFIKHRERQVPSGVVLANTSTWKDYSTYSRGTVVLADTDRQLRNQTNGSFTIIDVFNRYEQREPQNLSAFTQTLENGTGQEYDRWTANYITGTQPVNTVPTAYPGFWRANIELLLLGIFAAVIATSVLWDRYKHRIPSTEDIEIDQELATQIEELAYDDQSKEDVINDALSKGIEYLSNDETSETRDQD